MIRELILLCLSLNALAFLQMEPENVDKRSARRLCGEHLAQALHKVCLGKFFSPLKKSYPYSEGVKNSVDSEEKDNLPFPYRSMAQALSVLKYRRVKRGVHNECCLKGCTLSEMQDYCAV